MDNQQLYDYFSILTFLGKIHLVCLTYAKEVVFMNLSSIMSRQVAELQHTVSLSLVKTQMATQAAQAVVMLQDMKEASHPHKGTVIDQKG